jgi:hypothetical protein
MMNAALILTHSNPDLDAIGFVYSARKTFGFEVLVECRKPTREELEDPAVIVGDIGLLGCEELGHSPDHNNFDHHYSYAERSAAFLFNQKFRALRDDVVAYIDAVDTRWLEEKAESTLKIGTAGVRIRCQGDDRRILEEGGALLQWIEETGQDPNDLWGPFPPGIQINLQSGWDELETIRREIEKMERFTTTGGRSAGYAATRSPVLSLVKEEMFAAGVDIAVAHDVEARRFSIACNLQRLKDVNLKEGKLITALNAAERTQGACPERVEGSPPGQEWGGHPDRIGSPKSTGSFLSAEQVLELVKNHL